MRPKAQPEKLKALFHSGKRFEYQKGETILRARETPRGIYLVEDGMIKLYSLPKQGSEHVLDFLGPGDVFPIIWPFRQKVRSTYYEAISKVTMWLISYEAFMGLINEHPGVTSEILERLVSRYHLYVTRVDNLLYSDARERAAYRLLSLADRFGVPAPEGLMIDALITHEDLAHSIATTRETFGRSLARLQRSGMIGYDSEHHIVIKDLPALAGIIGHDETKAMWPELLR